MREDRQLLMLTHLSQLLDFVSGIGGFVVPLILWILKKRVGFKNGFSRKSYFKFPYLNVFVCINLYSFCYFLWTWIYWTDYFRNFLFDFSYNQCCKSE